MNTALVLSGGNGSRMNADIPKQYIRVNGRMLISYAMEALLSAPSVDNVVVVAEYRWREAILGEIRRVGLAAGKIAGFADPGVNRQYSVLNGLEEIFSRRRSDTGNTDTVLVHDAARPLLRIKLIEDCYRLLDGHDGVMPVLPVKDTMYTSGDGKRANGLLKRSHIFAGQTPELFLLEKYYQANIALMPAQMMAVCGSSEPAILAGMDIVMIPGDEENFKVTTATDMQKFRQYVRNVPNSYGEETVD